MSTENTVARGGRDVDSQAEPAAFQIPPEVAAQYQVRVIDPSDGSPKRIGMFLPNDRVNPAIEIAGDRIVARNEDPETVAALVKIAKHNGWEGIDVDGSPEFRRAVWEAGSREGLTVRGYEPKFDEQARMEDLGSAPRGGVGTPILGRAKDDQAASAGRLMRGLSLNVPIVSSVM